MHEYSVSAEIVKAVLDAAEEHDGKKVVSIQLEIGELALLNVEQVTFWIDELFKGTVAEGARIKVKKVKAEVECVNCGYQGRPSSDLQNTLHHLITSPCPKCGSLKISIKKGRECLLRRIQAVR